MNAALVRALLFLENEPSPSQLFSVYIGSDRQGLGSATHVFWGKYSQFLIVIYDKQWSRKPIGLNYIIYLALNKRATVLNSIYEELWTHKNK